MIRNPLAVLTKDVAAYLTARGAPDVREYESLAADAHWRPHLYDKENHRAWYVLTVAPDTVQWVSRIEETLKLVDGLQLGIAGPIEALQSADVLDTADKFDAAVLIAEGGEERFSVVAEYASAIEFVYEGQLQLDISLARTLLDRSLRRVQTEENSNRKGILLEETSALLFSQVRGFRVIAKGIRRRNQQMDVAIVNSNVGGLLGGSGLVLGEAKNWNYPVGPTEYVWLLRKMQTSNGRSKLGFFVTTDHFTRGAYIEAVRDTSGEYLIVLLDRDSFPAIWREHPSIHEGVEVMVLNALQDQRQRPEGF